MKVTITIVFIIFMIILIPVIIGWLLPIEHTASRSVELNATPTEVWNVIRNIEAFPKWRPNIKSVEKLPNQNGLPAWREIDNSGDNIEYMILEEKAPQLLINKIISKELPFGGGWTFDLKPFASGRCVLTITENGEVYNPFFRFMSKFILGHTATMEKYLEALQKKLDEK